METNPQLELASNFLQYTGTNVFLTGKAGTGKTTFLHNLKVSSPKRMVVLAPTGVAAINAGGMTLHSFFQLPFGPYVPGMGRGVVNDDNALVKDNKGFTHKFGKDKINIIRSLDLLVIDEISMVRADLLDAVSDMLCRYRNHNKPFGGVQLLLIGDLQQLSPVVKADEWDLLKEYYESPFFFNSKALSATSYVSIELTHIYRQSETVFINLLNSIRDNNLSTQVLNDLNKRYIENFNPPDNKGYITLTTHNYQAQQINTLKLGKINEKCFSYRAEINGNFPEYSYPTDEVLLLKKGAQVMFVKNDSSPDKRYYNGKIGYITDITNEDVTVKCDEEEILVSKQEWTNAKYTIDVQTREITETIEGTFTQYPLKAAWAITIHKSQGLTFEKAIVDAAAAFSHGQVYVALSRCKTLGGLVLSSKISSNSIISDIKIQSFVEQIEHNQPSVAELDKEKQKYYTDLLIDFFDYNLVQRRLQYITYLFETQLNKLYPQLAENYKQSNVNFRLSILDVAERFKNQLRRMVATLDIGYECNLSLNERVCKGVEYFSEQMEKILLPLLEETNLQIDNKETKKVFDSAMEKLQLEVVVKKETLEAMKNGFNIKNYLEVRAKAMVEKPKLKVKKQAEKLKISADIKNPMLYNIISAWRKEEAERLNLPVYTILHQKALLGISNSLPVTSKELLKIPGIGKKIIEKYGAQLLKIVEDFLIQ
ncbi:MAG: AAA family ATPase [Bacteroidales bacterium]